MRKIVKAMKEGHPFYYLPDMDFGPKESIFVPFFGVQAATIPALSRLVRLTGALGRAGDSPPGGRTATKSRSCRPGGTFPATASRPIPPR